MHHIANASTCQRNTNIFEHVPRLDLLLILRHVLGHAACGGKLVGVGVEALGLGSGDRGQAQLEVAALVDALLVVLGGGGLFLRQLALGLKLGLFSKLSGLLWRVTSLRLRTIFSCFWLATRCCFWRRLNSLWRGDADGWQAASRTSC